MRIANFYFHKSHQQSHLNPALSEYYIHSIHPLGGGDDGLLSHVVGGEEGGGEWRVGLLGVPFHLEERELPVGLLDVVDLLLLIGAPEIAVRIASGIVVGLDALADEEILPQGSRILPEGKRREILQDGIADAVVIETELLGTLQLRAQVTTEPVQLEDDEALLQ